ncbi:hypothetical protein FMUND_13040 [Fusarium mundagurra]|uniref:Uncharacterized protein n=1 Tax=Fusarium mundagurra TaxID=1567541 RepID=A0A8H5Y1L4_9HYPO|nr:hypothetical protein FMUND_13040 [Fusarium mundagurra]
METLPDPNPTITEILPPEVVVHIISHFCSHCNSDIEDGDNAANVKVLVALTQTSRDFRSYTMPILFHSLGPHLPSTYIFRVLDNQPDLARTVKHLCLPLSTPKSSAIMSDSALFTRFADKLSLDPKWTETTQFSVVDVEMSLAMALCSSIDRLKIQISDDQITGHTRHFELLYSLLENRKHEEIFPKLRHLDVDKTECTKFSLCDPEPILLLRGAPRLQTLIFRGPGEKPARQNSDSAIQEFCAGVTNIKELQIQGLGPVTIGSWQTRALERILGAAQNLETFKFVGVGSGRWRDYVSLIPATQFLEFLSPQTKKTLQRLSLNFDRVRGRRNSSRRPITPQQIKQFTCLKTLEVDPSCYCTQHVRDGGDIDQCFSFDPSSQPQGSTPNIAPIFEQETYLVDFLPQTVQTLTIFLDRWAMYGLMHDSTLLAQRVVSGKFPNLKRVRVDAPIWRMRPLGNELYSDWTKEQRVKLSEMEAQGKAFQEKFVGSGVETRFKTWIIYL